MRISKHTTLGLTIVTSLLLLIQIQPILTADKTIPDCPKGSFWKWSTTDQLTGECYQKNIKNCANYDLYTGHCTHCQSKWVFSNTNVANHCDIAWWVFLLIIGSAIIFLLFIITLIWYNCCRREKKKDPRKRYEDAYLLEEKYDPYYPHHLNRELSHYNYNQKI